MALSEISKSFGAVTVADAVSFELPAGQALGIIGPNGAGKTSLFNLITGTLAPDSGRVQFAGKDVTRMAAAMRCRLGIARSFQIPQPFTGMSVFENVLVGARHGDGLSKPKANIRSVEILEQTGLLEKANDVAGQLTLLERKRLELARALAAGPELLLLDEIAGGLTEHECQSLIQTIEEIKSTGVTIVWIEHIVHALLAVVDRLIVIDFGRVVADGEPNIVMQSQVVQDVYIGLDANA
ncbi:MAG: ABC transporter ATP-binding protein [Gammaproteobacteria bacterium]|nr:ABC transporter ATP-binding protein [Gammaproteobacteria bacterium]